MPGSTSYDPPSAGLEVAALPIAVYRYDPDAADESDKYTPLPNLWCERIEFREFEIPAARLRYAFDEGAGDGRPTRFEQVMDLAASGPLILSPDDRVAIFGFRADGTRFALFDGFASMPQLDYGGGEAVTITVQGTPVRCYDRVVIGSVWRDSEGGGAFGDTFRRLSGVGSRINPDGHACMITAAAEKAEDGGMAPYPTFVSRLENPADDPAVSRVATLGMAVRYLLYAGLGAGGWIEKKWVTIPYLSDDDFRAQVAKDSDTGLFDPSDKDSFTLEDIECPEIDLTGMAWPDAIRRLIAPFGFAFKFVVSTNQQYDPTWDMTFYRKDGSAQTDDLALQPAGGVLDPSQSNAARFRVVRDGQAIANRIVCDTEAVRYQTTLILAPLGWSPAAGDASLATRDRYRATTPGFARSEFRDAYRVYGFDEIGEGHFDFYSGLLSEIPGDLGPLLDPGGVAAGSVTLFARRPRPALAHLFDLGGDGKPLDCLLEISTDYYTLAKALYGSDGTKPRIEAPFYGSAPDAHWQAVKPSGWKLLKDRLGIRIIANDPTAWEIGPSDAADAPFPGGVVNAIKQQAPGDNAAPFALRLTCVVESDQDLDAVAEWRVASPTKFVVTRRVDARDRFARHAISKTSLAVPSYADSASRDDTADARQYAQAVRRRNEMAGFAGSVTINWFTAAYGIGQSIARVAGRDLSLRGNFGTEQGEGDTLPAVVAFAWDFAGGQSTTLELTDDRARRES